MADATEIMDGMGWARAFGGVGNALGARLELPGAGVVEAVTDPWPEIASAAFLEVMLLDETRGAAPVPLHPMVGERLHESETSLPAGVHPGPWALVLNRGRFTTEIDVGERSFDRVIVEVYRKKPDWGDDPAYHSLVTLVFRLRSEGVPERVVLSSHERSTVAVLGPCDHLGMVLLDVEATTSILEREGLADATDLIAVFGNTEVGTELIRRGELVPLWGMRPWLYRLSVLGPGRAWCPLGGLVAPVQHVPTPPGLRRLTVVPGRALLRWDELRLNLWPQIALVDPARRSLRLELWSLAGFEPITPGQEVGILPTFVVTESAEIPSVGEDLIFGSADPFSLRGAPNDPWMRSVVR